MTHPKKFWRINYDTDADLDRMVETSSLVVPTTGLVSSKYDAEACTARRMKVGDGIFLGKLDEDTGRARIGAIGIIQDQKPVTSVIWKHISKTVFPNPQGGFPPWRERCFLFDEARADAYNLAADFLEKFPDLQNSESTTCKKPVVDSKPVS